MAGHDRCLRANGLRLHYLEWGTPQHAPVVLLHGGSAHAHWWDLFACAIADAYHVLALDLRGHGDSERPRTPAYALDDYAADLAAFIDALALPPLHLVGHSLGGIIATAYAGGAAATPRTLVVVDSQARISPAGAHYMSRLYNFPQLHYRSREEAIRRFRLLPKATTASPTVLADIAAHAIHELPDGRWTLKFDRESLAHATPRDLTGVLSRLTCPLLLVRGEHSTLLSARALATMRTAAPRAHTAEIPGAHHHVMLDNPAAFARVVRNFLDRSPAAVP
jgi:pimeloyl-ACP methyl ester carboxylesterase